MFPCGNSDCLWEADHIGLFANMEFTAGRDPGEHLLQLVYITETKAQRYEMTFLQVTQVFSQEAMNSQGEKSLFILLLR